MPNKRNTPKAQKKTKHKQYKQAQNLNSETHKASQTPNNKNS